MVDSPKKASKKETNKDISPEIEEEYELMPHRDIVELREELRKLKSLPPEAGRQTEASFEELTKRMDRLTEIFEEAEKTIKIEEGAATFKEKMAPVIEKMNTILQQNSEIAEGIVALADIMNEIKDKLEVGVIYKAKEAEKARAEPMHAPRPSRPSMPPMPPMGGMPDFGPGPKSQMPFMGMPEPRPESQIPGMEQMPSMGMPEPRPEAPIPGMEQMPSMGGLTPPPLPRQGAPMPPFGAPSPGPMPPPPAPRKGIFGKK